MVHKDRSPEARSRGKVDNEDDASRFLRKINLKDHPAASKVRRQGSLKVLRVGSRVLHRASLKGHRAAASKDRHRVNLKVLRV
ncbi:MAG TPA: hypothetical protein VGX78_20860, partial [Pirellulales bacterium]|nr:hypothetical protein [Pirellulales bacterium]